MFIFFFFFQAEDGIRDDLVTGVQTCALPIWDGVRRHHPPGISAAPRSRTLGGGGQGARRRTAALVTMTRDELKNRCGKIEECYEFMLAYAAQGLRAEPGGGGGSQIRTLLTKCDGALDGLGG